jgi:predicted permease
MSNTTFEPTDQPKPTGDSRYRDVNSVGQSFFETYRIPILYGRSFGPTDTPSSPRVAVINQSLSHSVYPNVDPVGKTFVTVRNQGDPETVYQIIGVSADAKYDRLQGDPQPTFYTLYRQAKGEQFLTYTIKMQLSPTAILPALRNAVESIDKDVPLRDIRTQTEQIEDSISQQRLFATLTAGFGVLALVLACIGIYGIMAYNVARRTNEIGVRMALGARAWQVLFMVLRESSWLAILGITAGLVTAIALTRFVGSMLYDLKPSDPTTLIAATLILLAIAIAAAYGPARRASRIDPTEALRHE